MSKPVNIGPRERRKRFAIGVVGLIASIGLTWWLVTTDAPRWYRFFLMGPFYVSILGFLHARAGT